MKKLLIYCMVICLFVNLFCINNYVYAENTIGEKNISQYQEEYEKHNTTLTLAEYATAAAYAFLDFDTASPKTKELILAAREKIIFSESWAVEYGTAWIETCDGKIQMLPAFYSLFPEDWAVPCDEMHPPETETYVDIMDSKSIDRVTYSTLFNNYQQVNIASNTNASDFKTWRFAYSHLTRAYATSIPGTSINFGFSRNGSSIAFATNLGVNEKLVTFIIAYVDSVFGVRCSTYSTPGLAKIIVDYQSS